MVEKKINSLGVYKWNISPIPCFLEPITDFIVLHKTLNFSVPNQVCVCTYAYIYN